MQELAWYISLLLIVLIGLVFIRVARNATQAADYHSVQANAYGWRAKVFWGLMVLGVIVAAGTLRGLPYVRAGAPAVPQVVTATGSQWSWDLEPAAIVAGKPVEFRVTSTDVNHGFGIYDADNRLLAQAQAMPGYVNLLRHTFDKPGTYRVLCLEYCGLIHHEMIAEFEVKAP